MKSNTRLLALYLGLVAIAGTAGPAVAADDPDKMAGPQIFAEDCGDCHKPKKKPLDDEHKTRAEWKQAIDKMLEDDNLSPKPSKVRIAHLLDWLEATHGPIAASAPPPVKAPSDGSGAAPAQK